MMPLVCSKLLTEAECREEPIEGSSDDGAAEIAVARRRRGVFMAEEEEGNLAESIPIQGVVQHTLEVSLTGECSLPTDSGASVTIAWRTRTKSYGGIAIRHD